MEKAKIDKMLAETQETFTKLETALNSKIEERKVLDKQMANLKEELIRLQGDYRAYKTLSEPEEKAKPKK